MNLAFPVLAAHGAHLLAHLLPDDIPQLRPRFQPPAAPLMVVLHLACSYLLPSSFSLLHWGVAD